MGELQVARRCVEWSAKDCICNNDILYTFQSAQLDAQANSYPHRCTRGRGGWNPRPLDFLMCCSISKRFYLQWKAFDLLYKVKYILWVVALALLRGLWRHQQWSSSWILPRIKNQVKTINHKSLEWTTECVYESTYVVNGLKWKHQVDVHVTILNRKKI